MPKGQTKTNYAKLQKDTQAIADNSPATETKEQMKSRIMARERITLGDYKVKRK